MHAVWARSGSAEGLDGNRPVVAVVAEIALFDSSGTVNVADIGQDEWRIGFSCSPA